MSTTGRLKKRESTSANCASDIFSDSVCMVPSGAIDILVAPLGPRTTTPPFSSGRPLLRTSPPAPGPPGPGPPGPGPAGPLDAIAGAEPAGVDEASSGGDSFILIPFFPTNSA